MTLLDNLDSVARDSDGPVRLPVLDRYKEKGTTAVLGKLESGTLKVGDLITMMPNKVGFNFIFEHYSFLIISP